MYVLSFCFYVFLNDKTKRIIFFILKRQEEFNVMICSRLKIINLYVRCILNIQ